MTNITNQPITSVYHDLIGTHNCVSPWGVFQSLRVICSAESIRCRNRSLSWMIGQHKHKGNVRVLLFCSLNSSGSNPVKATIPAHIEIANVFFRDLPLDCQFQSGEQPFIRLPVTNKETAFPLQHILSALHQYLLIFIVYTPPQTISIVCG